MAIDNPERIDGILRLSVARLAAEFGMGRDTVQKRLQEANVPTDTKRNGHPVYRLRDACPVLIDAGTAFDGDGNINPDKLPPEKRKAWFQSEQSRLAVECTTRGLIRASDFEEECATLVKSLVQFLDTLGDQLERDCALTPTQVEAINASIDRQRQLFYARLTAEETEAQTA